MSLRTLARRLPAPVYRLLQRLERRLAGRRRTLPQPNAGPLITETAPRLAAIPGWLNLDDLAHFTLVLATQSAAGLHGDLLEIGCFHGRSAALLAGHLQTGERLILADAFDLPLAEPYGDTPSPERVWRNLEAAVSDLPRAHVEIHRCYSRDLHLAADIRLRFAHVDGGHDAETVQADLALCAERLVPGGVLAVDDYAHPVYAGVAVGVRAFLAEARGIAVLADLNRSGALGRKLYLVREA